MSSPGTLITAVLTGTVGALVAAAAACERVGAAVAHLDVRDGSHPTPDTHPTLDPARLRAAVAAVRAGTRLVVRLPTGGVTDPLTDRLAVLDALPDAASCPLAGERPEVAAALHRAMRERGVAPAYEVTDLDQLDVLRDLLARLDDGGPAHVDLVLGAPGGMAGDIGTLAAALRLLPAGVTWSASGVGPATLPVLLAALAAAGHTRVGPAGAGGPAPGERAKDDTQLVARASGLARIAQRPPVDPDAARTLLGVAARPVASA